MGTFTGDVTLQHGTLFAGGINPFGTGKLAIDPSGAVNLSLLGSTVTLGNLLALGDRSPSDTLTINAGNLIVNRSVVLSANTTWHTGSGKIAFTNGISGAFTFRVNGGATFALSTDILGTHVIVPSANRYEGDPALTGDGTVETANGVTLYPHT